MRLLPAQLPSEPPHRSALVAWRLARNIAPLFAIDLPDNSAGATWVCDYNTLTLAEIARGAPLPAREKGSHEVHGQTKSLPKGQWGLRGRALLKGDGEGTPTQPTDNREIAPATLNRFGPDRKAAAVLIGADTLLRGALPAMEEVIRTLGVREHGGQVAPRVRVMIWAALVHELYRSQPALFAAAVQARRIQRALTTGWSPMLSEGLDVARCEFGSDEVGAWVQAPPDRAPRTLAVLDETLRRLIKPALRDRAADANQDYLADELVGRWPKYLLQSEDSGLTWIVDADHNRRRLEVYQPITGPLNALLDEIAPSLLEVDIEDHSGEDGADPCVEPAWRSLLPRVPGEGELRKLDLGVARLTLWILLQIHRVLRESHRYGIVHIKRAVTEDLASVHRLATALFGADDLVTVWARNRLGSAQFYDNRLTDAERAGAGVRQVRETVTWLLDHSVEQSSAGLRAELLIYSATTMVERLADARTLGLEAEMAELRAELGRLWLTVFSDLRIQPSTEVGGKPRSQAIRAVAPLLHGYASYLSFAPAQADRAFGLQVQEDLVIKTRTEAGEFRHSDTALGRALHQAVSALWRGFGRRQSESEVRSAAEHALQHSERLAQMRQSQLLLGRRRPIRTQYDADIILAVFCGRVMGVEAGLVSKDVLVGAEAVLAECAKALHLDGADAPIQSAQQATVVALLDRVRELAG